MQLIYELLVNGTLPSAVPANIQTVYDMLYRKPIDELPPSVSYVRSCRVIVEVIGDRGSNPYFSIFLITDMPNFLYQNCSSR